MHLIAMGANLPSPSGGPLETLEHALKALQGHGITVTCHSRWYETPAYPAGSGPAFVNGAAVLHTPLAPAELLAVLHTIEADLGRVRGRRWAPRACDLDLLASDQTVLPDAATVRSWIARTGDARMEVPPGLLLPHPRLQDRGFVLVPLADVAPDWRHPLLGQTVRQMRDALPPDALDGIIRLGADG